MRKYRIIMLTCFLALISLNVYAESRINDKTIMVGEFIYNSTEVDVEASYIDMRAYMYEGKEGNSIKIKDVQMSGKVGEEEENVNGILSLPLNKKKQCLLRVKDVASKGKVILITVIDDFGSIKAQEYKGQ